MTGLDTNVLIRYMVRDDESQAEAAAAFIRDNCTLESPGWVSRIVLVELVWVLQRSYAYSRDEIAMVLDRLLRTRQLAVEDVPAAWQALAAFRAGTADFADALMALTNGAKGCEITVTFDRRAAGLPGMRLLD